MLCLRKVIIRLVLWEEWLSKANAGSKASVAGVLNEPIGRCTGL
jgi:hypothetical protein